MNFPPETQRGQLGRRGSGRSNVATITPSHSSSAQLGQRPDREAQELAARRRVEDADRLEPELPQREIGELGRLPDPAEREALHAALRGSRAIVSRRLPRVRRKSRSE